MRATFIGYNHAMDYDLDRMPDDGGFSAASDEESSRFAKLIGASRWLIAARGRHVALARNALAAARAEGIKADLLAIDDDAFDTRAIRSLIGQYRHIVALCGDDAAFAARLQDAMPETPVVSVNELSLTLDGVLAALRHTPRCC